MSDAYSTPTPPPTAAPGAEALAPGNASTVSALAKDYTGKMDALTGDMQKNFEAGEKAQAPFREKLMEVLQSPNAAKAHLEKAAAAPKPEDYQKYSMEFASAMAVMGALAGRFTRNAGNASLNAFAGAIKGWKEGNLQAYETAAKEWEQNNKKTLENNNIELEKYKEVMADKKMNIDQMMAAMNLVATQYQNKIVFDSTVAKNYTMAFGAVDKMILAQDKLQKSSDKLTQLRADQAAKVKAQVDTLNANPEMLAQMPLEKYLPLKGAAEALGLTLNDHPGGGTWKAQGQPRSANAIAVDRYIKEGDAAGTPRTSEDIQKFSAKQAGLSSEQRAFGNTVGNLKTIIHTAYSAIPRAEELSDQLPRGQFVPLNQLVQLGESKITNETQKRFLIANLNVAELWAKAMNVRGVMRESDRDLALKNVFTADTPQNYKAALSELRIFLEREQAAVKEARDDAPLGSITGTMTSSGGPTAATPPAVQTPHSNLSDDELKKKLGL